MCRLQTYLAAFFGDFAAFLAFLGDLAFLAAGFLALWSCCLFGFLFSWCLLFRDLLPGSCLSGGFLLASFFSAGSPRFLFKRSLFLSGFSLFLSGRFFLFSSKFGFLSSSRYLDSYLPSSFLFLLLSGRGFRSSFSFSSGDFLFSSGGFFR